MATPTQLRSYGRIGLLATTFVLAAALVVGAWLNYRSSQQAVSTLYRGQAEVVEAALRSHFPPWAAEADSAALQLFVDSFPQHGVTYLAVIDSRGTVRTSVGTPVSSPGAPPRRGRGGPQDEMEVLNDRVRMYVPLVTLRRGDGSDRTERGEAGRRGSVTIDLPESPGGMNPPLPPDPAGLGSLLVYHLVEFEPVVATTLVVRASRSLALSIVSATLLTLAALLFWRTSEQYAAARVRMEEQRRLSVLGEMSAVLAHEIRNPLASLKGSAQLLAERLPEGSRNLQRADRIVAEAIRLEALTSDLLDFARSGPILIEDVDPVEMLRSSLAEVGDDPFEVDAETAPRRWRMDARRMRHALVNILQNAAQARPAASPPMVRVMAEQKRLIFEIRDFGPGLPPEQVERIFDPFFTTRTNGTGLGLAVAQRVVEMHGGRIVARNHVDGGAVFRIEIPDPQS